MSDLAPAWMQTEATKPVHLPQFRRFAGFSALRQGHKQTFLMDSEQPIKSQYSLGDFRHNVRTKEEAEKYMAQAKPEQKRLVEWPVAVEKGKVTEKVGSVG